MNNTFEQYSKKFNMLHIDAAATQIFCMMQSSEM